MFPSTYTWTSVLSNVTAFLSEPIVQTGTLFVIALPFVPKLIRTLRKSVSAR